MLGFIAVLLLLLVVVVCVVVVVMTVLGFIAVKSGSRNEPRLRRKPEAIAPASYSTWHEGGVSLRRTLGRRSRHQATSEGWNTIDRFTSTLTPPFTPLFTPSASSTSS